MLARQLARRAAPLAAARRLAARPVAGYHTTVEGEEGTESWRMKFSVRAVSPPHCAPGSARAVPPGAPSAACGIPHPRCRTAAQRAR